MLLKKNNWQVPCFYICALLFYPLVWARYAKNERGMICVFRNDYPESTVNITLSDFPDGEFTLTDMVTGELIKTCSGKELRSGLEIIWQAGISCRAIVAG